MNKKLILLFILLFIFTFIGCRNLTNLTGKRMNENNHELTESKYDIKGLIAIKNDGNQLVYYADKKLIYKSKNMCKEYSIGAPIHTPPALYLTEDGKKICFEEVISTRNIDTSTIKIIDTEGNITIDLGEKIFQHKYNLYNFSYSNGYILALKENEKGNVEPILIDLNKNTFEKVILPKQDGILNYYRYNIYKKDLILIFYYEGNEHNKTKMLIADKRGKIINKIENQIEPGISYVRVSNDGKYMLYSAGKTPVDLYLFDFEKEKKYTIIDSLKSGKCLIFANWEGNDSYYYKQFQINNREDEEVIKKSVSQ